MGLFGNKQQTGEKPLYETSYVGFWIKVYPNRVEFKNGVGSESIPINQVASVRLPMMGIWNITLETTGGERYTVPTSKKKEVQKAIHDAQSHYSGDSRQQTSDADEIAKLNDLKEKGVITEAEFKAKKKQLLGL
jgi:hypothetical protein